MKNLIIIEKKSIFNRLLLLFFNKKHTLIYYFHPYQIDQPKKLITRIKGYKEFKVPHNIEQAITYKANKEAFKILDERNNNQILTFFISIGIPKEILIAFKKYQLAKIAYQIRIAYILNYFDSELSNEFKFFCFMNNSYGYKYTERFIKNIDTSYIHNISMINIFSKIWILIAVIFYIPIFTMMKIIKNGFTFRQRTPKNYKYGFHLNNNIYDRNTYASKNFFTKSRNDYLLSKILNYNDEASIYIISHWNFDHEDEVRNLKEIKLRKANLGHEHNNPLTYRILKIIVKYYLKLIKFTSKQIFSNELSLHDFITIIQIIRDLLLSEIFCSKYRISNFISRDDFSPIHISRTIVFNKYNIKNNGISHSGCLSKNTSMLLPYTYFNTFYTQGNFYYEYLYKDFWFSKNHKNLGPIYGKLVEKALSDKEKKSIFNKKYGNKKSICFLLGNFNSDTPFDSPKINFNSIKHLLKILELDKDIILFVVSRNDMSTSALIESMEDFEKYKDRIFIDYFYSTYELMAYCKYLITGSTSSSIFEGTLNPKLSIIPLNVRAINKNPLYDYKDIKVFEDTSELYEFFMESIKCTDDFPLNNNALKKLL